MKQIIGYILAMLCVRNIQIKFLAIIAMKLTGDKLTKYCPHDLFKKALEKIISGKL